MSLINDMRRKILELEQRIDNLEGRLGLIEDEVIDEMTITLLPSIQEAPERDE
jgi:hypothetical protein